MNHAITATHSWRWLLLCLTLLFCSALQAEVAVPALKARVTDLTGTLAPQQHSQLEESLKQIETRKGSQVAILMIPTTAPETIEQYSLRVSESWKLGRKDIDDGLLILVAVQDRALRLEVGYGLEGVIPDAISKRIISETITPHLRKGDYYAGLSAGVEQVSRLIEGEALPEPKARDREGASNELSLGSIFIATLVLAGFARAILGKLLGGSIIATVIGITVWIIFSSFIFALIMAIFAFVITIGGGSRLGGINIGGGGGGGFGGGGFGGGGGGFGGGGASGRW